MDFLTKKRLVLKVNYLVDLSEDITFAKVKLGLLRADNWAVSQQVCDNRDSYKKLHNVLSNWGERDIGDTLLDNSVFLNLFDFLNKGLGKSTETAVHEIIGNVFEVAQLFTDMHADKSAVLLCPLEYFTKYAMCCILGQLKKDKSLKDDPMSELSPDAFRVSTYTADIVFYDEIVKKELEKKAYNSKNVFEPQAVVGDNQEEMFGSFLAEIERLRSKLKSATKQVELEGVYQEALSLLETGIELKLTTEAYKRLEREIGGIKKEIESKMVLKPEEKQEEILLPVDKQEEVLSRIKSLEEKLDLKATEEQLIAMANDFKAINELIGAFALLDSANVYNRLKKIESEIADRMRVKQPVEGVKSKEEEACAEFIEDIKNIVATKPKMREPEDISDLENEEMRRVAMYQLLLMQLNDLSTCIDPDKYIRMIGPIKTGIERLNGYPAFYKVLKEELRNVTVRYDAIDVKPKKDCNIF